MKETEISIRSIQHYLYCPHRWGLIEIDRAWAENFFVTKANLMHERVHDPNRSYLSRGKRVYTSVPVYNDLPVYNLYGVTDCIEVEEQDCGKDDASEVLKGKNLCIVEYKPTKPKDGNWRMDDLMQIFAQKLCVDYVFSCDCAAEVYYADVKRRYTLPLRENFREYDEKLKKILEEMHRFLDIGQIPPIRKGQKCNGCSMKDLCMPKLKKVPDLRKQIRILNSESDEVQRQGGDSVCDDF